MNFKLTQTSIKHFLCIVFVILSVYSCKKNTPKVPDTQDETLTITDGASAKLANSSGRNDVSLGFPRDASRLKTSGTVRVAVIFVDFSDAPARNTPEQVFGTTAAASQAFMSNVSYNKLDVVFEPKFKWFRMTKPSTSYGWENLTFNLHKNYIQEAVSLAQTEYDFFQTDEVLIIANPEARALNRTSAFIGMPTNGINVDRKVITNAMTAMSDVITSGSLWFPHELGHNMGAPDLYNFTGSLHGSVGEFSVMGNTTGRGPVYNAWEKWLFGWFTDSQVTCVKGKGTGSVQLTPVELQTGMKLLVLPLNATSAVIVEDRRKIGYDNMLPKEGPLVYLIDMQIPSGEGQLKVLPRNSGDQSKTSVPLSAGQSVTYNNVTVKCTASGTTGSTIEFERK